MKSDKHLARRPSGTTLRQSTLAGMSVLQMAVVAAALAVAAQPAAAVPTMTPTNPIVNTVTYDYEVGTGRRIKQIVEGGSADLCAVTTYQLDAYGHQGTITTRNCNGSAATLPGASGEGPAPAAGALSAFASRVLVYGYSADGRFVTTTKAGSLPVDTQAADPRFGRTANDIDPNGISTATAYDGFGRKVLESKADGTGVRYSYALCAGVAGGTATCPATSTLAAAYAVTTTPVAGPINTANLTSGAANGPYSRVYYDGLGREIRTETPGYDGSGSSRLILVDTVYNTKGQVAQKSRPYYSGDAVSWIVYQNDALSRVYETDENDASGPVTTLVGYHGMTTTTTNGLHKTTSQTRNARGDVVSVLDANGFTVTMTYDAKGDLVQSVDAKGNVVSSIYDILGHRTELHDPDLGNWTYAYDAAGDLVQQVNAMGATARFGFDNLGRMTSRSEADLNSTWSYDTYRDGSVCSGGFGKLCEEYAGTAFDRRTTYDGAGRVVAVGTSIDAMFVTGISYNADGRVDKITYPSGLVVQQGYTALGYLKTVTDLHSNTVLWTGTTYDASNRPTQYQYGNAVTTNDTYYDDGRLHTRAAGASNAVQGLVYTYDAAGNPSSRIDSSSGVNTSYGYDALNRVTSETRSGPGLSSTQILGYQYDSIGNIQTRSEAGVTATYLYNASGTGSYLPHAVSSVTGPVSAAMNPWYAYDGDGNVLSGAGRSTTWTSYDMVSTISSGGNTLGFTYSSSHSRARETYAKGGVLQRTTNYVDSPLTADPFFERDTGVAGTKLLNYVVAPTGVVAVITTDGASSWSTQYWHKDHVGSVTVVTNTNASAPVAERLDYEPFGKRRFPNGVADPNGTIVPVSTDRGFTGQEEMDEVGLVNMNGRVYDASLGRFMSADPTVPYPQNLQSYNRYSYSRNNPLRANDPSGFDDEGVDDTGSSASDSEWDLSSSWYNSYSSGLMGFGAGFGTGFGLGLASNTDSFSFGATNYSYFGGFGATNSAGTFDFNINDVLGWSNGIMLTGSGNSAKDNPYALTTDWHDGNKNDDFLKADYAKRGQLFCASDCSKTDLDAEVAAANRYTVPAIQAQREAEWWVYKLPDGTFSFTYPWVTAFQSTQGRPPDIDNSLGSISSTGHVHWDGHNDFSGQDLSFVMKQRVNDGSRVTLYLSSGDGLLKSTNWASDQHNAEGDMFHPKFPDYYPGRVVPGVQIVQPPPVGGN